MTRTPRQPSPDDMLVPPELEAKLAAALAAVWEAQRPARQRARILRGLDWARHQKASRLQRGDEPREERTS
jgi:hypothetical protein